MLRDTDLATLRFIYGEIDRTTYATILADAGQLQGGADAVIIGLGLSSVSTLGKPLPNDRLPDAPNRADDVVYRGDTRAPDEIFEDGFQPKNPGSDTSLEDYVDYNMPSDYVSTTTNRPSGNSAIDGSPEQFRTDYGRTDGYVYEVDRPSSGIDVNQTIDRPTFPEENEIAVPGGIDSTCIRGCTPIAPDGSPTGGFIANPNYSGGQ